MFYCFVSHFSFLCLVKNWLIYVIFFYFFTVMLLYMIFKFVWEIENMKKILCDHQNHWKSSENNHMTYLLLIDLWSTRWLFYLAPTVIILFRQEALWTALSQREDMRRSMLLRITRKDHILTRLHTNMWHSTRIKHEC